MNYFNYYIVNIITTTTITIVNITTLSLALITCEGMAAVLLGDIQLHQECSVTFVIFSMPTRQRTALFKPLTLPHPPDTMASEEPHDLTVILVKVSCVCVYVKCYP